MDERLYLDDELFLRLEVVAEVYEVRVVWLQEVCEAGLLRGGRGPGSVLCIAAIEMDRVATIVRLHRNLGMSLEAIAYALD